ncbi:putative cytochrome P450 E-class, group I [Triangularia verruculosa]|uniref:Cytochrome P450 E-class, group I n=1 Tax=Triangularia verruculosa TaxID=2587418 RepID=A0AAN7AWG1_9PEZI|nr:putative cytochrome P450 E-class, group I [Triangularia verruculosa]
MGLLSTALWAVAIPIILFLAHTYLTLLRNYINALKIGVPVRAIPIDQINPFWMIMDKKVLAFLKRYLPFLRGTSFARFNWRGFEIAERYKPHHELGDVYIVSTTGRNWLYLGDPDLVTEMFKRRNDFPRCSELTKPLNVFGTNLGTSDGAEWRRQRKVIATCFTEQANAFAWSDTVTRAHDMLRYWISQPSLTTAADDLRTLSLGIMSQVGFGEDSRFEGHQERLRAGGTSTTSHKDTLQEILENCVLIMALGPEVLAKLEGWLPKKLENLRHACVVFQSHMTRMYEETKTKVANRTFQTSTGPRNFLTSLVQASHKMTSEGLTEKQLYGNMFMLAFAGHDTVAHTFTFATLFLAGSPEIQDWISEEVRSVLGDRDTKDLDYERDFPRLKRCLAVMLETVRLYSPVAMARWTESQAQTLQVGEKTLVLPPNTLVIPSYSSLHTDPRWWGEDSLTWRPTRWIEKSGPDGEEELMTPRKGTFLGWSEGMQDCPGRKFSKVEFVATMATLFRDWRVDPVLLDGESLAQARKRVLDFIVADAAPVLLLQMTHPERVPLIWKRR